MSRCILEAEDHDGVIGRDPPIGSFFLQVLMPGGDIPIIWEGVGPQPHLYPDDLIRLASQYTKPFDHGLLRSELMKDQANHLERHYEIHGNEFWGTPAEFEQRSNSSEEIAVRPPHDHSGKGQKRDGSKVRSIPRSAYPRLVMWVATVLTTGSAGLWGRGFGGPAIILTAVLAFFLARWVYDLKVGNLSRATEQKKDWREWAATVIGVVVATIFAL